MTSFTLSSRKLLLSRTALSASLVGLVVCVAMPASAGVVAEAQARARASGVIVLAQSNDATVKQIPAGEAVAADDEAPATAAPTTVAPEAEAPAADAPSAAEAPASEAPADAAVTETEAPAAEAASEATAPAEAAVAQVVITEPEDPVAKKAFAVLEKHCSRCHQDGRLKQRLRPAKNFGNVLSLETIARDSSLIQPGNPDASRIFTQIIKKEMPYDTYYEFSGSEPTPEDVTALRDWIAALGQQQAATCANREAYSNQRLVEVIATDLQKEADHRIKGMRYVTLTNLYNACAADDELNVYRQAVIKLLNSLSRESDVLRLAAVDEAGTILKFNLDDLGWEPADWERLLAVYPYAAEPDVKIFEFLKTSTGTALPYIRGDWMAFAASRPPLYHEMLKLPKTFDELQKSVELDIGKDIEKFLAKRAGFQVSGVSRNNRLIERHSIKTGVFWTSYDFAGNKDNQSLFEHPLGPTGEGAFKHDGGETVFSLPNGYNGYYLNTADGKQINTGPTNIVQDTTQKDLSVTNGISCMGCHDQGFRKAKDDIRAHVENDRSYKKDVRESVIALYPTHEEMDNLLAGDVKRFRAALESSGVTPDLKYGGVEMINALSKQYEKDVNLAHAAAEFGLVSDEFLSRLEGAGGEAFRVKRRLAQGVIPRDTFETSFREIIDDVTDDKFIGPTNLAGAAAVAVKAEASETSRNFELALFSDKSTYAVGDLTSFTVTSKHDCHLTLINVDSAGKATVIFPNEYQQDNFLPAGKEIVLPGASAPFQFRLKDPGTETVIAACNASSKLVDGIKHDFGKQQFTELGNYEEFVSRSIGVEETAPKKKGKKASEEAAETGKISAKGDVQARTAIKLEVK